MLIEDEFFEWMYQMIDGKKYYTLLRILYDNEFYSIMSLDDNRLIDGVGVRYRFADEASIPYGVMNRKFDKNTCSVLEMMLGLAIRIEETIMSDADYGDRTSMWFWMMVKSLGLYDMTDEKINAEYSLHTISRFLNRDYEPNGMGSLFTVQRSNKDMRDVEIWYQMCLFFDSIL